MKNIILTMKRESEKEAKNIIFGKTNVGNS